MIFKKIHINKNNLEKNSKKIRLILPATLCILIVSAFFIPKYGTSYASIKMMLSPAANTACTKKECSAKSGKSSEQSSPKTLPCKLMQFIQ